jgi:hypothetical protein
MLATAAVGVTLGGKILGIYSFERLALVVLDGGNIASGAI